MALQTVQERERALVMERAQVLVMAQGRAVEVLALATQQNQSVRARAMALPQLVE